MKITINFNYIFAVAFTIIFGYDIWKVTEGYQLTNHDAITYGVIAWIYIFLSVAEEWVRNGE
jgi:hypothetical protein